jgi:hypothetical protein
MDTPVPWTWIGSLGWGHWSEGMGKIQATQDWFVEAFGRKSRRWVIKPFYGWDQGRKFKPPSRGLLEPIMG